MVEDPILGRGFRLGDRIEVEFADGIPRHGRIQRIFRSGNLTVVPAHSERARKSAER